MACHANDSGAQAPSPGSRRCQMDRSLQRALASEVDRTGPTPGILAGRALRTDHWEMHLAEIRDVPRWAALRSGSLCDPLQHDHLDSFRRLGVDSTEIPHGRCAA